MNLHYRSFNNYLKEKYGTKVQRISLNAGFSCPNRDGTLGKEGCIFCNEKGFSHYAQEAPPLKEQIRNSMEFAKERFGAEKFIAYFQNATNTHAAPTTLKKRYDVIRSFKDIVGLYISTRPDAIDDEKLDLIETYADDYEVWIEYGIQTIHENTLKVLNRLHTFSQSKEAILKTAKRKIKVGVHVIIGLPDESRDKIIETAIELSRLPISGVKFHILHVLKDTKLESLFKDGKVTLLKPSEYVTLVCDFLERIKSDSVIFRLLSDAKKDVLVSPLWINEKQKIIKMINDEFEKRKTYQGSKYAKENSLHIR